MNKIKELGIGAGAIILLGILTQLMFPWWSIVIVAFWVGCWVADAPARSFTYGFFGVALLWGIFAAMQHSANGGLMSGAMSNVFSGKLSATQLIYFTGILGGLVGGLAAMSGTYFRHLLPKKTA